MCAVCESGVSFSPETWEKVMVAGRVSQSAQPPGWVQDSLLVQAELYWLKAQPVPWYLWQ